MVKVSKHFTFFSKWHLSDHGNCINQELFQFICAYLSFISVCFIQIKTHVKFKSVASSLRISIQKPLKCLIPFLSFFITYGGNCNKKFCLLEAIKQFTMDRFCSDRSGESKKEKNYLFKSVRDVYIQIFYLEKNPRLLTVKNIVFSLKIILHLLQRRTYTRVQHNY